jgi:hypothetical protein
LREVPRLRVLENRVLRKIFRLKRDDVIGKWRTVHNDGHHKPYFSPNIIRVVISRRMRWASHVECMGERRGVHMVLAEKSDGKKTMGR